MPSAPRPIVTALRPLAAAVRARRRPVRLGSLGRTVPVSSNWGLDRGTPVDRWYIDRFLGRHRDDIRGRVLEIKDSGYTDRFGTGITERGVLDVDDDNPLATYVGDLAVGEGLPTAHFDCFVLTQTLQYIFDLQGAVREVHRILRPGGVVLATMPAVSRIDPPPHTDLWRFTPRVAGRLFADEFGPRNVLARGAGNVFSQLTFLEGIAVEELDRAKLAADDERFPLLVTVRAVKERSR
jgi:SAM-dependent methyltransferase